MNKTIKTIGHKNYFNLLKSLSIDIQDLVYKQIRLEVQRLDVPVNEEDLGEIVSDVLKTAYEFKY
jgi:hypothetical protein